MNRFSLIASACLVLAACGSNSPQSKATQACTSMLGGDPEIEEDLAEDGKTLTAYCGCFGQLLADQAEADQAGILKVSETLSGIRDEKTLGLEEAAETLYRSFDGSTSSETYDVSMEEFEQAGKYLDTVRRELNKEESACPAS